ncbi:hypothetical protein H072_8769 [Dactylellina haptotyla CBS 200.50]|uniref:Uncharacterized protein n=1 Tax=Dactylellina haptotyla (strain CBS 200.50) TaxID=1284197 RepID=S8A3F2_DACHA|nr:hypothetical protein H072_8769 [Dactylellina haptotyla CBS 200.50]
MATKSTAFTALGADLEEVVDMITIDQPLAATTASTEPTLQDMVDDAVAGIENAKELLDPNSAGTRWLDSILAEVRAVPQIEITLQRDIWGARDGQPWARNIWTVIGEFADYLTNSGEPDWQSPETITMWLYQGYFDPVVGVYELNQGKADDILLAAGHISQVLQDRAIAIPRRARMSQRFVAGRSGTDARQIFDVFFPAVQELSYWMLDYSDLFKDIREDLEIIFDPNSGNAVPPAFGGAVGAALLTAQNILGNLW